MARRRATAQQANVETKEVEIEEVVGEVASEPEPESKPSPKPRTVKADVGTVETKEEPQPLREGVPDGLILGPNEPLRVEGDDNGVSIVVRRDIYREVYPLRAKRPSYVLMYAKGTEILKSRLVPLKDESK